MIEISVFGVTVAGVVIALVWFFVNERQKWKNRPPGPIGLPFIGNLHQLARGNGPLEVIQDWRDQYGDVVGIRLGQYKVVILSGYETIKEAYSLWDFSGRPLLLPFHAIGGGEKRGLLLSEGQAWTEQRRFALRNLRDFGFGKKSMESLIHDDINEIICDFKENKSRPFVPHRKFATAVVKSLWNIIAGEKFTFGDPKFQNVLDGVSSVISSTSFTGPVFFFPWLGMTFPGLTGYTKFKNAVYKAKDLIRGYIQEHQKTFQEDNIRDLIDCYLKEIKDTQDKNSSFYGNTGNMHMLVGTLNLMAAGSETTSSTLTWALMYLMKYPAAQEKLYEEIISVYGKSALPSLENRDSCPYTWAFMEEVLRMSSLVPMGVFHNTMNDVTFRGHFIEKDTLIFSNLYGVHYDKKIWGDPEVFRPERFLLKGADNKTVKNPDAVSSIPFSVGKRTCLGEVLARNNFFLYLTSLVQNFQFTTNEKNVDVKAATGFIRIPQNFEIIANER